MALLKDRGGCVFRFGPVEILNICGTDHKTDGHPLAIHFVQQGDNAIVKVAVADRLAQKEGEFQPFDRSGPFGLAYARPEKG